MELRLIMQEIFPVLVGFFVFNLYRKLCISWDTCSYTEFIQICNFFCLIMIMNCDCWKICHVMVFQLVKM